MSDKKHIDKLFQEKFENFEATPSPEVWNTISAELGEEKKERKAIPIWLKIGGIAAGLLLLITLGIAYFNEDGTSNTSPTEMVDSEDKEQQLKQNDQELSNDPSENDKQQLIENGTDEESLVSEDIQNVDQVNPSSVDEVQKDQNNSVVTNENRSLRNNKERLNPTSEENKKANVPISNQLPENRDSEVVKNDNINDDLEEIQKNQTEIIKEKTDELIKTKSDERDSEVAQQQTDNKAVEQKEDELLKKDELKESMEDAVAKNEELNEELEKEKDEESNSRRWSVMPNIAPVYYNSFGSGSAIDDEFKNNSRTGEVNMSYGVAATYAVNDKLKLRAGINQLNLSYRTNDVVVYNNIEPNLNDKPLKNVDLNEGSQDLSFLSATGLNFAQVPGVVANTVESSIDQELGFIEIPIEIEYTLSDKKLDVNVIGGFSTLILSDNKIYSSLQGDRNLLGEANNVNSTSFSANLGIGFNLEVSERIDLNLEPVFKYQLNTFKDTEGSFNPYTMGITTGVKFKF